MKLSVAILSAILLSSGAATAQQTSIPEKIGTLVAENAGQDEHLIGEIKTGRIDDGDTADLIFTVVPGKTYWLYGACDDDCYNLDLEGLDEDGNSLDDDKNPDAEPVLLIAGEDVTRLRVIVEMTGCDEDTCAFGVGLYESGKPS